MAFVPIANAFFLSSADQQKHVFVFFFSRWVGLPMYFSLFTDYNLAAVTSLGGVNIYHRRQCCPLRLAPRPGEVRQCEMEMWYDKQYGYWSKQVIWCIWIRVFNFVWICLNFKTFSYIREDLLPLELKSWQSWHNSSWWLLIWIECIFIIDWITPWELDIEHELACCWKRNPFTKQRF